MKAFYFDFGGGIRKAVTLAVLGGSPAEQSAAADRLRALRLAGATFFVRPQDIPEDGSATIAAGNEVALLAGAPGSLAAERAALERRLHRPVLGVCAPAAFDAEARAAGFAYLLPDDGGTGNASLQCPPRDWFAWHSFGPLAAADDAPALRAYPENDAWGGTVRHAILTLSAADCARLATPLPRVLTPSESVRFQPLIATRLLFAAADALYTTADHTIVENPTAQPVTGSYGEDHGAAPGTIRVRVAPGTRQILTEGAAASRPLELADPDAPGETFLRLAPGECFVPCFPGHRRKALTFSYDDGAVDDARVLEILNRHGCKGTFNLNSDRHPRGSRTDSAAPGHAPCLHELPARYAGHEVAVHGCGHETWGVVPPAVTLEDVLRCRRDLESVFRRPILGLAYPCGYSSKNPRIDEILRACGIIYARTIEAEDPYALPEDFFDWAPTSHHNGRRGRSLADIGREFLALCPETVAVCYIWGHSFEFPARNNWEVLEDFCTLLDNHPEIWRVTNRELYDYTHAVRSLVRLEGGCVLCNPMAMPVCGFVGKRPVVLRPCSLIECCLPDVQR